MPAYLHDIEVDSHLRSSVIIEREDMDLEFARLPGDLAYWNERYARSLMSFHEADLAFDHTKAQLFVEHKLQLQEKAGSTDPRKGANLDSIKAAVEQDERYMDAKRRMVIADVERVRMRGVCDAVTAKKDMLQSLGAKLRSEMSDPIVRNQVNAHRIARDGDES